MEKEIVWIGTSKEDLKKFPKNVMKVMGYALDVAQKGGKAEIAKPLKSIVKGATIFEIVDDYDKDTYRAVYAVKFEKYLYVLHTFKKKSTKGISTPKHIIDLVRERYKEAKRVDKLLMKDAK